MNVIVVRKDMLLRIGSKRFMRNKKTVFQTAAPSIAIISGLLLNVCGSSPSVGNLSREFVLTGSLISRFPEKKP